MEITINNKTYNVPTGSSVSTVGGKLYVNGELFEGVGVEAEPKFYELIIMGDVSNLEIERGNVTVHGNVTNSLDAGGNVTCKDVTGDVDAGGNVTAGNIGGDLDAGGNVTCQNVEGDVDAGGNVLKN